ncbi:hypothetical protein D770_24575 [Flammeovirgaceae bacterium 311]|nr:hypothetical protein D770_24575 [Flammeovirgaceae bacterium 311]
MKDYFILLMLFALLSCEKEPEVVSAGQPSGRLLVKTEYRTSYGHVQADSFIYDHKGLNKRIFYYQGAYNSEKLFVYKENMIQMFGNNGGVLEPDFMTELKFDQEKRLSSIIFKTCCDYVTASEIFFEYKSGPKPSAASGTVNATYTFNDAGNLVKNNIFMSGNTYEFVMTYDDKANPYKQLPYYEFDSHYFSENNVLNYKQYKDGVLMHEVVYDYTYDAEGYPLKMVSDRDTTYYYYR